MTNEEAIERLKQNKAAAEFYAGMVQNTNSIENELKDIEAMNMAIEALSGETPTVLEKHQLSEEIPTNTPTDLISRADAIEAIASRDETDGTVKAFTGREVNGILSALPSADRPTVDKEYLIDLIQEAVYDGEACEKLIDLVDRPTGEMEGVDNDV